MSFIVATCKEEGGLYTPDKDPNAPIRFYSDRRVEDDFLKRVTGRSFRERLSVEEYRRIKEQAKCNRAEGRV